MGQFKKCIRCLFELEHCMPATITNNFVSHDTPIKTKNKFKMHSTKWLCRSEFSTEDKSKE